MNFRIPAALPRALAFICAALLAACATVPSTNTASAAPTARLQMIKYAAEQNSNQGNALSVDIVYVFSESAVAQLPLYGPDWFAQKPALLQNLGANVEVIPASIAPGTTGGINIPGNRKFVAAMAYTNHVDPGAQPFGALTQHKCALITVKASTIMYSECG